MKVVCSVDNKIFLPILLLVVLVMIAFSFRQFTAVPDEPIKIDLTFEPLSEEKIAKAAESYRAQERTIQSGMQGLNNLQLFTEKNSDPLPQRKFVGLSATEMCETGKADCVTPFARIRPLIVTAPNYHMMSCITQKSMSTVMSAIFCFLIREKEFIDAGRSILREYSDIRNDGVVKPLGNCATIALLETVSSYAKVGTSFKV
ncbi:hypothetical protein RB195_003478 [Necator americanus]|uniref:Uncharacterized protein n=1 Tax=Necator americanus TaxID=51031 RepID=A0ABR1DRI8_NECAM